MQDFTEVDNNVTRHVPAELRQADWNGMIMHYLGLDHIGHKTGPEGPNMLPKQKEMDGIVKVIYEALEREPHHSKTLFILAGDHGMNAGGNHGGSGPGETEPALLFASPQFARPRQNTSYDCPTLPKQGTDYHFYNKVEQSDLVPTLSVLLGLPIPRNNLGVALKHILGLWSSRDRLALLRQNTAQMLHIVESTYGRDEFRADVKLFAAKVGPEGLQCSQERSDRRHLSCKLAKAQSCEQAEVSQCEEAYYDLLYSIQDAMSSTASSYNLVSMTSGIALASLSLTCALFSMWQLLDFSLETCFLTATAILYGVMMFASSYVEEEQHFWYWLTPAWFAMLAARQLASSTGSQRSSTRWMRYRPTFACWAIIAIHRLNTRWNQTGQKHTGQPDIVHTFFPEHYRLMWLLILGSYIYFSYNVASTSLHGLVPEQITALFALATFLTGIVFKLNFTQADAPELVQGLAARIRELTQDFSLVTQARTNFTLLATLALMVTVLTIRQYLDRLSSKATTKHRPSNLGVRLYPLITLFLSTQTRAPNVPLLLLMDLQSRSLRMVACTRWSDVGSAEPVPQNRRTMVWIVSTLLLAHTSYFCFGGSNSISSLDLSNAYNGVADYDILAVGILLFASNWTGPIWWSLTCMLQLSDVQQDTTIVQRPGQERAWVQAEHEHLSKDSDAVAKTKTESKGHSLVSWSYYIAAMTVLVSVACVAVMAACTALRTHLFVWTVFSPKYLYTIAWSIGWHILINVVLGGVLQALIFVRA